MLAALLSGSDPGRLHTSEGALIPGHVAGSKLLGDAKPLCTAYPRCERVKACEMKVTIPDFDYGSFKGSVDVAIGNSGLEDRVKASRLDLSAAEPTRSWTAECFFAMVSRVEDGTRELCNWRCS